MQIANQTQLMNFRIPVEIREHFYGLCRFNHISMTSQLVKLMKDHISNEGDRVKAEIEKIDNLRNTLKSVRRIAKPNYGAEQPGDQFNRTERHGNWVKDSVTQTWMEIGK